MMVEATRTGVEAPSRRARTLPEDAITRIRELIESGRWRPGQRLPRETDLAIELGLSRNSLREAIRALSLARVLDVRRGDGTYVSSLEPDLLLGTTSFVASLLQDHTVLELFEVRRLLEPTAAALAAVRMDDHDRQMLRGELDRMLAADRQEEMAAADMAFHSLIARGAGNRVLSSILDSLFARTLRAGLPPDRMDPHAVAVTHSEHVRVCDAMMSRDPELARALSAAHVASGELRARGYLDLGGGGC